MLSDSCEWSGAAQQPHRQAQVAATRKVNAASQEVVVGLLKRPAVMERCRSRKLLTQAAAAAMA
jgi:hypothetical protein